MHWPMRATVFNLVVMLVRAGTRALFWEKQCVDMALLASLEARAYLSVMRRRLPTLRCLSACAVVSRFALRTRGAPRVLAHVGRGVQVCGHLGRRFVVRAKAHLSEWVRRGNGKRRRARSMRHRECAHARWPPTRVGLNARDRLRPSPYQRVEPLDTKSR